MTTAALTCPSARESNSAAAAGFNPVSVATMRVARSSSLALFARHVDHQVVVHLAGPGEGDGRDLVQHELGRRPGLEPGRPGQHLRPGDRPDGDVDRRLALNGRSAGDEDRLGPSLPSPPQRSPDERRRPARGDADGHVTRPEVAVVHGRRAGGRVVLGPLDGTEHRPVAAGDHALHLARGRIGTSAGTRSRPARRAGRSCRHRSRSIGRWRRTRRRPGRSRVRRSPARRRRPAPPPRPGRSSRRRRQRPIAPRTRPRRGGVARWVWKVN